MTHDLEPFRPEHFDRWYRLWVDSIDMHWAGPTAEAAKAHAVRIASVLARQLTGADWSPTDPAADRPAPRELQPTCPTPEPRSHR